MHRPTSWNVRCNFIAADRGSEATWVSQVCDVNLRPGVPVMTLWRSFAIFYFVRLLFPRKIFLPFFRRYFTQGLISPSPLLVSFGDRVFRSVSFFLFFALVLALDVSVKPDFFFSPPLATNKFRFSGTLAAHCNYSMNTNWVGEASERTPRRT